MLTIYSTKFVLCVWFIYLFFFFYEYLFLINTKLHLHISGWKKQM